MLQRSPEAGPWPAAISAVAVAVLLTACGGSDGAGNTSEGFCAQAAVAQSQADQAQAKYDLERKRVFAGQGSGGELADAGLAAAKAQSTADQLAGKCTTP